SEPYEFSWRKYGCKFPRLWIDLRVGARAQHPIRPESTVLMPKLVILSALLGLLLPAGRAVAQRYTDPVVRTDYQLTARPWKPLGISREKYLDAIEGECRFSIQHQNASGAIIDPFIKREH